MAKNTKVLTVLSTAAVTGLITAALGSTAFAKTSAILVQNGSNDYKYDYSSLASAFEDYSANPANGALYQDYLKQLGGKSPVALYDDVQKTYIDYTKVASAFEDAQAVGKTFSLNAYTESSKDTYAPVAPISDVTVGSDGKIVVTPVNNGLTVTSVSNVNLKSFTITFNQAIDNANTLSTDTLKVYKNGSTTAETYTTAVSADKTKVTVALTNALSQGDQLRVVVNGVKNAAGSAVTPYDATQAVSDTLQPSFVSLTATTAKNIDVVFNKPVNLTNASKVWDNFYVDGIKTYATATVDPTTNKVSLQLASNLAAGSHTFKVTGVRDFAGFLVGEATGSFNVSVDTEAPSVKSVTAVGKSEVKVVFSEPLSSLGTVTIGSNPISFSDFNLSTTAPTSYVRTQAVVVKESDNVTYDFYLPTANFLTASDVLSSKLNYKGTTDIAGNKVDATKGIDFAFTAPNDTTVPTVTSSVVSTASSDGVWSKNDVKLVFSKDMDQSKVVLPSNYVLKKINTDGTTTVVTVPTPVVVDSKTVKIPLSGLASPVVAGGNYTLEYNPSSASTATLIQDDTVRSNALANKVDTLTFNDEKQPTRTNVTLLQPTAVATTTVAAKPAIIRVVFDEAMDVTSLTNPVNYIIGTSTSAKTVDQIAGVTLTAASDNKSVDISIPNAVCPTITTGVSGTDFTVLNVKDVAGNPLTNFNTPTKIQSLGTFNEANTDISGSTLQVTGKRTLTWKLASSATDSFASIDPNEFVIKNSAASNLADPSAVVAGLQVTSAQLSDSGKTVTLTLNQDLNANGTYGNTTPINLTIGTVANATNTKDVNGAALSLTTFGTPAADAVAPTLTSAKVTVNGADVSVTMSADGKTGTIDLSNATGNITDLKVTASESGNLTLVSPYTSLNTTKAVGINETDIAGTTTLANLQKLATLDGDGDDNTLTITGLLADGAAVPNKSAVVLKVKVK